MKYFKNSDSYLLIEVMLAVAVISLSMIAILHALSYSVAATGTLRDSFTALTLIENKIWEFEKDKGTKEGEYSGVFEENDKFKWKAVIEPLESTGGAAQPNVQTALGDQISNLNMVTVTVSWQARNQTKTLTISTHMRATQ